MKNPAKASKKKPKSKDNAAKREVLKKRREALRDWGMDKDGYIKATTPVFFKTVNGIRLHAHPLFKLACIPHMDKRVISADIFAQLLDVERQLKPFLGRMNKLAEHRYGANKGVNLGKSVVTGGTHARNGYSGSIHRAKAAKSIPRDLHKQICDLISTILLDAYGDTAWFRRMERLCSRLNSESKEERCVQGSVFSAIWLNMIPKEEAIHCDENIVGPIFTFSTYPGKSLVTMSENERLCTTIQRPGVILGGLWGSYPHCNLGITESSARAGKISWVLYLDKRVFGKNYKYVTP